MEERKAKSLIAQKWNWEKLGDVCSFRGGGTPSKKESGNWNGDIWWASVKDIKGDYLNSTEDKITEAGLENSSANLAEINSVILITRIEPGKSIITNIRTAINQDLKVVIPKFDVLPKFIHFFFKAFERDLIKLSSGTTVLGLTLNRLNEIKIPVIDVSSQQAIVSKIEELFSELDKGVEQLKTAQRQLKIYRQAVLKWAFEGRFTNENVKDGELPEGWEIAFLKDICNITGGVTKGRDFKGKTTIYLPYLRVANVQDGYLDLTEIKTIEVLPADKEKYRLLFGDILYTEGGDKDKLGRGTIWKDEIEECIHQNHIFRARPILKRVNSQYLSFYSQTKSAKMYFFKHGKQTTNLASINLTILSNLPVPISSEEEQREIVQEIERRLSVADKMEESIIQSLQQAETLRQSILKKAFEGKLVESDTIETIKEPAKIIPLERKVLAGKIIHLLHDDKYFGLTKFQKILYLVENFAEVPYETNFSQERAGPYDKEFTIAFRKEMQEKDWLQEQQKGKITKFIAGDNIGSLIKNYGVYFREKGKKIVFVIQQLKDKSTHEAELIATLYAVWNNRLIKKKPIKIDLLVEDFFNWSAKKKDEFQPEEVVSAFKWMKQVKFAPSGFGKFIGTN